MAAATTTLHAIGTATPPGTLAQDAAAEFAQARCCSSEAQRALLRRIYRNSGVSRRGSVLLNPEESAGASQAFFPPATHSGDRGPSTAVRLQRFQQEAGPLAANACHAALASAAVDPWTITHLITVSCTGLVSPGLDAELVHRLGLVPDVGRVNLGFMGCHGALNGLRTASALAASVPHARVLLCCVELCSLHFQYGWQPQTTVANALFADGAGAVVVSASEDSAAPWRLVDTASRLVGHSDAMTWRVGDHGFEMTLSREVPELIRATLGSWLDDWLGRHRLAVTDIDRWAIHPGGPRIIRTVEDCLGLPEGAGRASAATLAEHGNMSSPTVLFVLNRLQDEADGGPCVVMGFGPGLSLEAALLH
jgi:predicted naringenin-chalcone synthase